MPTAPPRPPLARTSAEAHLYMDLRPCECGETAFPRAGAIIELGGEELGSRYGGECPGCEAHREFLFRLPAEAVLPPAGSVVYGDGTPSELLDPGEWLWVADRYAGSVPADASGLDEVARRQVRTRIAAAVAALDEVLAFVPADADVVPVDAVRSEIGHAVYAEEPGRFDRDRLEVVRDTYHRLLGRIEDLV
jgi:hypothetical protein